MTRDRGIGTGVRLPDFLGIGTQKGGTTYLHGLLQQHPQVFLAHPKELHFFSLHHHGVWIGMDIILRLLHRRPVLR